MKTRTKWLLGILIGLVVIVAIGAITYIAIGQWNGDGWLIGARAYRQWDGGRGMPWREMPGRAMPGQIMPWHPGRTAPGFRLGGLFAVRFVGGSLICLGLIALIGLGIVALVRSLRRPSTAIVAPVQAIPPAPAPVLACPSCGRPVQADWSHCPYCGTALPQDQPAEIPPA